MEKEITMEELNGNVEAPAPVSAPVENAPVATAAPAVTPAPIATPASAPVVGVKMELPKTTGQTPGGWNRFAGYKPNTDKNNKNKPRDRR